MTLSNYPLDQLRLAPENPRQTVAEAHIERLAANIKAQGLKQNLVGYAHDGVIYITAGGCRLRALVLNGGNPIVPVRIEAKDQAIATALSENTVRADMGHAQRVRAYKRLHAEGMSSDDVIAVSGLPRNGHRHTMLVAHLPDVRLDALDDGETTTSHADPSARVGEREAV